MKENHKKKKLENISIKFLCVVAWRTEKKNNIKEARA